MSTLFSRSQTWKVKVGNSTRSQVSSPHDREKKPRLVQYFVIRVSTQVF